MRRTLLSLALASLFATGIQAQTKSLNYEAQEISTILAPGGITAAWARGYTGKGSTIAIVDQGFDLTHSDLTGGKVIASRNFYVPEILGTGVSWGSHGTMMAGIAAGNLNGGGTVGVAPDAKLLLAQVGGGGSSTGINFTSVKSAIDWASANGATVINLSLGSSFDANFKNGITQMSPGIYKAPTAYGPLYGYNASDVQAFAVGTNRGSIIVAAAGNQGLAYSQVPGVFATQVDGKGNLVLGGKMLIVGYSDTNGNIAGSSNKAGSICSNISGTTCNDPYLVKDFYVVAPGMQMYGSAANQLGLKNANGVANSSGAIPVTGSSGATAYVSGGVALMKQAWPQLKSEQIVSLILNTATSMGDSNVTGRGMVNFDKATQPMGTVALANMTKLNGSGLQGKTVTLAGTGVATSGSLSLVTNSVLQNTQVVDGIGRNYAVNLTQAVGYSNSMSYQYGSPWMAMAGGNYRHFASPVGKDGVITFMSSDYGTATQYEWQHDKRTRFNIEMGALKEMNGVLGTQGAGAMSIGGSNTTWFGGGGSYKIADNTALIGNYTMGVTRTSTVQDSMVQLDSTIISDSWKLGARQDRVFINQGKLHDAITVAVAQPVQVRSGSASVTGVTSYTYTDNGDGTSTANPQMQTVKSSLAPQYREMDLVLGYNIKHSNTTDVGFNVVRQFNAGGAPGVQATGFSIMARSIF
jgi:subtilisin family serine protease